jgi:hypothetical protein
MGWTCTQHKSMRTGSNSKRLCSFIHGKGPAGSWTSFLCWVECQSEFRFSLAPIGNERERWMDSFLFHGCDCKACHAKLLTFQCPTLVSKSWDGSSKDGLVIAKKKKEQRLWIFGRNRPTPGKAAIVSRKHRDGRSTTGTSLYVSYGARCSAANRSWHVPPDWLLLAGAGKLISMR